MATETLILASAVAVDHVRSVKERRLAVALVVSQSHI